MISQFITVGRFNRAAKLLLPASAIASIVFLVWGLYSALLASPPDYQQGEYVRIMYVHVPSAWLSLGIYFGVFMAASSFLVWKNPMSGIFMKALIPLGTLF